MEPIRRILCPIDFSEASAEAFAFAERLAMTLSAEIVLLHVSDREPAYQVAGQVPSGESPAHAQLEQFRPSVPTIPLERVVHSGSPGEVICWLAQDRKCDLIVIGTHGRRGLMHLLMGSVAEYVMRHARCPVLSVRQVPEDAPPLKEPLGLPVPAPRFM